MKDKNGIEIKCENCDVNAQRDCANWNPKSNKEGTEYCVNDYFLPSYKAYEARIEELQELASTLKHKLTKKEQELRHESSIRDKRIAELQKELHVIQESEHAEAKEADRLREEIKELKKENERLSKEIIDLGTGTLAEKNYQSAGKQIQNPSESFYWKYSGVSEEYALGALEQCATEADELQEKVNVLEKKLTETVKLLGERSRECGELEAYNEVLQRKIRESSIEL